MPSARSCRSTCGQAPASPCGASRPPARRAAAAPGRLHSARAISIRRCWPDRQVASEFVQVVRHAHAAQLALGLGGAGASLPRGRGAASRAHVPLCDHAGARPAPRSPAPSCPAIIFTCWKVRDTPRRAICRAGRPADGLAAEAHVAAEWPTARRITRLKVVDLPAPFGPIRPTISPARSSKLTSFTATSPPKVLADGLHVLEQHLAGLPASRDSGAVVRALPVPLAWPRRPAARQAPFCSERPESLRAGTSAPAPARRRARSARSCGPLPISLGSSSLSLVLDDLEHARAGDGAPHARHAADDGHEQVLDAHLQAEGRGVHRALDSARTASPRSTPSRWPASMKSRS